MSEPSLASWTMTESKSSRLGGLGVTCRDQMLGTLLRGGEEDTGGISLWRSHERVESSRQEPTQHIAWCKQGIVLSQGKRTHSGGRLPPGGRLSPVGKLCFLPENDYIVSWFIYIYFQPSTPCSFISF